MAYELSRALVFWAGPTRSGTPTSSPAINAAFVFETSGAAFFVKFNTPVGQSAATITLYVYVTAVTGAPTFQLQVRNGYSGSGDGDRPQTGGSNLASSPSTLTLGGGDVGTWVALTATVSLTAGNGYWLVVENTHGTPASNHATFQYRGSLDNLLGTPQAAFFAAGYTTDGFATDPTVTAAGLTACAVVKFADGTLFGNPYVTNAGHANNANTRGNRFTFSGNVVVSGLSRPSNTTLLTGATIYTTAGASVVSAAGDAQAEAGTGGMYRFTPTTLTGGVPYDVVLAYAGSTTAGTVYSMGMAEANVPADVLACRPWGIAFVDGATPGSFTVDTSKVLGLVGLLIDDFPAAVAGGLLRHPGMGGGMVG